ncbi:MAG: hypothetical protein JO053_00745 [Acidobacteria bacterium]|nr:hypothetical protein [Acidobacteriota bacterium]
MNKTANTELFRLFLIEKLPEPLEPKSRHLQVFDNYVEGTRMRIRQVRDPYSNIWTRILQQRFTLIEGDQTLTKMAEIHLNDAEYAALAHLEGREIRKNRYFHEFDRMAFVFDVYLGELWGLNTAHVEFQNRNEMDAFMPPPFAIFEVTDDVFFTGASLVEKNFADVQAEVARLGHTAPAVSEIPDE